MSKLPDENFRDSIATIDKQGKRSWIFAKIPKGKLYERRKWLSYFLLLFLFSAPFLKINGNQFLLFNVLDRKFNIFSFPFWPQDFHIFVIIMIIGVVSLALFTVAFGRIFCGWFCPQTIFMEMVFRKFEYWIEGDAQNQRRLDAMSWNFEKFRRRGLKLIVFFTFSFLIANYFLAYIVGMDELLVLIKEGIFLHFGTFSSLIIFTFVFFFVYLWFREQVCIIVCPYGRLQGVLLDKNSILVAYDYVRGEPRGKMSDTRIDKGDCVNCAACVRVCPTGIDIRNGTQLECVNCTACIDACDDIMDHIGKPKGLIRYASENNIANKEKTRYTLRLKMYTVVLLGLLSFLATLLITRDDVSIRVMRTAGQMYQKQINGGISNLYNIKLANKTRKIIHLDLKLDNVEGEIQMINAITVPKESYFQTSFFIVLQPSQIKKRKTKIKIGVFQEGRKIETVTVSFLGPAI